MPEEGEARERWIEKSAVLFDLILQSVNKEMFEHIKDLVEADDSGPRAWKLLRDVIQPNTLPLVIVLEKELAAISMRPGDDVKPVLDKIKDTYARMAAVYLSCSSAPRSSRCTARRSDILGSSASAGRRDGHLQACSRQMVNAHKVALCKAQVHKGDVGSVGKVVMHPLTHWVIDSGCTSHMTPRADMLDEVKPPGKIKYVAAASGVLLPVIGVGNAKVKGANGELVGLGNVLLVEGLCANLLSVRRLQKSKAEVTFGPTSCRAKLGKKKLVKDGSLKGLEVKGGVKEIGSCPTCLETKFSKFPFNSTTGPAKTPLALVALVKNRVVATVGDKEWIPYTKWYGSAPAVNMLRAFGCHVVFHVPKEKRGKLEASGRWGVHLGIAKDHKGWLLWDLTTQKLTVWCCELAQQEAE
ncbi:hypothetical protein CLOM_g2112 [Closterium sp. NIES-68]|nr:hypothetical protein CLOM_g2112 [Closterium sp. NIES-68]